MKKLLYSLLIATAVFVTACINMTNETTVKDNGSGTVITTMDMGGIFDMLEQMGKDPSTEKGFEKTMDSTFPGKGLIAEMEKDLARKLTADEEDLLNNTVGRIQMNAKDKLMKFTFTINFKKLDQLAFVPEIMERGMSNNPMGTEGEEAPPMEDTPLDNLGKAMTFKAKDGLLEYAFNKDKHETNEEDQKMIEMMDQMGPMLGEMPVTVIYNLPRPAKNVTTKGKSTLSADKRKVTITYSLVDMIKDPEVQAYKIEY